MHPVIYMSKFSPLTRPRWLAGCGDVLLCKLLLWLLKPVTSFLVAFAEKQIQIPKKFPLIKKFPLKKFTAPPPPVTTSPTVSGAVVGRRMMQ
jgi:hypothetical protein